MKQRLQENFSQAWEQGYIKRLPLQESRIIEAGGQKYTSTGAYLVPIWRLDKKNLNGRTYGTRLAKRVIESKPITLALIDHPEGDSASLKNLGAVGKNPQIIEGILYAECHFVNEEFQRQCEKVLALGGKIGLSSSALGELDSQGNVLEESFELERLFDFVPDPSYGVFLENTSETIESPIGRQVEKTQESVQSGAPGSTNEETPTVRNTKMTLEEKNFSFGIKPLVENAKSLTNPFEAKAAWAVVAEYCDNEAFAAPILQEARQNIARAEAEILALAEKGLKEGEILTEKAKIEESATAAAGEVKILQEALTTLSAEYETTLDLLENAKKREGKLKRMYRLALAERNGRVRASKFNRVLDYVDFLENELSTFKTGMTEANLGRVAMEEKFIKALRTKQKLEVEKYNNLLKEEFEVSVKTDEEPEVSVEGETAEGLAATGVDVPVETDPAAAEFPEDGLPSPVDFADFGEDDMRKHTVVPETDYDDEAPGRIEVKEYFEDLVREDPKNAQYREHIMCCRSLIQAQLKFMNLTAGRKEPQRPLISAIRESAPKKNTERTSAPEWTSKQWKGWD